MCRGLSSWSAEKYVDTKGLALPQAATEYLDTWKRTEELVLNTPDLPMLRLKAGQKEGKPAG